MAQVLEAVPAPQRWVGAALKRKEDPRLITGHGQFVDDLKLPNTLYAALLRSPYGHARIRKLDVTRARQHPGVVYVLTGAEVKERTDPFFQLQPPPANEIKDYCMAIEKVRFMGEPVAAVVATSRATAEDALELIDVEYDPMPVIVDGERALEKDAPLLHEQCGTNVVWHGLYDYGDVDRAFRQADRVVKAKLHFHRFTSAPLENNAVVVDYDATNHFLRIYCNNQMPMFALPWIAPSLRMASDRIRIVTADIGGGFGIKIISFPYIVLLSVLSMILRRPIKWTEERREHLQASAHGNERTFIVEAAVKRDGTILGVRGKAIDDTGAYPRYEPAGCVIWVQVSPGCYRFRHLRIDYYEVVTNKCPVGPNRGYSRMQHLWMLERLVDIIAQELGLDPVQVRLLNFIRPEEMPYTTPSGGVYDGGDYPGALRMAMQLLDYEGMREVQARARGEGRLIGIGFGSVLDSGANNFGQIRIINPHLPFSGNSEAARVQIDSLGSVTVAMGTVPQGQGHETVAAQVVADELGISPDKVSVLPGFDSASHPYTGHSGTYASRFAALGVGAVLGAVKKVKEKAAIIAAHMLRARPEDIEFRDGKAWVRGTDKALSFFELGNLAWCNNVPLPPGLEPGLVAIHVYKPNFTLPDEKWRLNQTLTYAHQTHGAVVEVDRETGFIRILRYVAVDDCGRVLNPLIVEGQVHGAAAHGVGAALYETLSYDPSGQLRNSTFVDYLAPTAVDLPDVHVSHQEVPSLFGPLGAKGVGEGGGTPLAAIANAVADALRPVGIPINDSHQNPEQLYQLLQQVHPVVAPRPGGAKAKPRRR